MSNVGLDDVFNLIQQVLFLLCLSFSISTSLAHINVCRSWLSHLLHFFNDLQQPLSSLQSFTPNWAIHTNSDESFTL
jgi:zinc transporter ZupT